MSHQLTRVLGVNQPHVGSGHEGGLNDPYGVSGDSDRDEATEDDGQDGMVANGLGARTSLRQDRARAAETALPDQRDGGGVATLSFKARPGLDRDKEDVAAERAVAIQVGKPGLLADQSATSGP